jgi:hypothetical protein
MAEELAQDALVAGVETSQKKAFGMSQGAWLKVGPARSAGVA